MNLTEIVGQTEAVNRLKAFAELYAQGNGVPEHVLLLADEGMGKRTIATAFAQQCGLRVQELENLEVRGDLTAVLTNLKEGQAVMLPNVHRVRPQILDLLQSAMRDGRIEIVIGKGQSARRHVLEVRRFTLIATAPKRSECPTELVNAFSLVVSLQLYSLDELVRLAYQIAAGMNVSIDVGTATLVARNCQGKALQIEVLLQRIVRVVGKSAIAEGHAANALAAFGLSTMASSVSASQFASSSLSGIEFERVIAGLLTRMGFRAEMTKTTGDGGIDIIAVLDRPIVGGKYLFQCKRYSSDNVVGAPTVRDFYGAVTADRAVKGILITTSTFTPQAREFAERVGLELIDSEQLQCMLSENGMARI